MESDTAILHPDPEREVRSARVLNVSTALAYRAWTEPEHLARWWGPHGFTNTFHTFELQPGGKWSFIMHGPDGKDYPNESVLEQILPEKLIVWKHISPPVFTIVVHFEPIATNSTKVIFRQLFETAKTCASLRSFMVGKNEENFDRMEIELLQMSNP